MRIFRRLPHVLAFAASLALSARAQNNAPPAESEPLTLEQAIQFALAKNYSIKVESFTAPIARANLLAEWGAFDPVFSASYSYSEDGSPQATDPTSGQRPTGTVIESDSYDLSLGGLTPWGLTYRLRASTLNQRGTFNAFADNYFTFAGVELTQPLLRDFGFGANLAGVRIARANRGIADWAYKLTVMDVITETIFVYHDLNFALKNLESARRSRDLAAGLLEENEKRFRTGSMSEADVTEARARVARREEAILIAERLVEDQKNFLKQLISDNRSVTLLGTAITITSPTPLPPLTPDPATDFKRALELRPDYQQAFLVVRRARTSRDYRLNQLLPRVDLVGSYGYNGLDERFSESRRQVEDREIRSYSAGAVVSFPLSWTAERGRYRASKLTLRQAEAQLEQLEQDILVRIGNAAGQIQTTAQRVDATRRARELAQQTLEAELKKLRAGTSTTFFVLQQQEILTDAESREYLALADHQKALAEYDRQLGLTLEKHRVTIAK